MARKPIAELSFSQVYPLLVQKAERKGRTRGEVDEAIFWLTGYTAEMVEQCIARDMTYGDFFAQAPHLNADRALIRGVVCGVRVEAIEDEPMRTICCLDKMVDELAKGKPMEKILRKS